MPDLAVDCSVAIKWFVVEPFSAEAARILTAGRAGALTLHGPDLLCAEMGNIAWKKRLIQGVAAADAQQIIDDFCTIPFTPTSCAHLLTDAYRLAVTHRQSAYDSFYLALSDRLQCPFVTADQRLYNAVGPAFPRMIWIGDWP